MPTRYSDEWSTGIWPYPSQIDDFLARLGASKADAHDAGMRVSIFMMTPISRFMPSPRRSALIRAQLLDSKPPHR